MAFVKTWLASFIQKKKFFVYQISSLSVTDSVQSRIHND